MARFDETEDVATDRNTIDGRKFFQAFLYEMVMVTILFHADYLAASS